jgi:flagellar basal body rod protein FlgG
MNEGYYISMAGGILQQANIDVAANNLANLKTTGFKRDVAVFKLNPTETEKQGLHYPRMYTINQLSEKQGGGSEFSEIRTIFEQGLPEITDNPLDLAINGDGFFAVRSDKPVDGKAGDPAKTYYTRNGNFSLNDKGEIVLNVADQGQLKLLDVNNQPITVPTQLKLSAINIEANGLVAYNVDNMEAPANQRIGIFGFKGEPKKIGATLFEAKPAVPSAPNQTLTPELLSGPDLRVKQGYLEHSNAEPIRQMLELMQGSRLFEANLNFLRQQDQSLERLTTDVGRSPA